MIHNFTLIEKVLLANNTIPHPVIDSLSLMIAGRVIQVSLKLGIFEILEKGPRTINDLSSEVGADFEGILVLADTLESLDYVKRMDNKYALTKRAEKFLTSYSRSTLLNTVLFSEYVFGQLSNLEETVKQGGPKNVNLDTFTRKQWSIFNKAMAEIANANVNEIVRKTPLKYTYKKLLDIGGSHGIHSIAFCKKLPNLEAEILDLEPTKSQAIQIINQHKMSNRVKFRIGDFLSDNLGKNFDIVLSFNIIHGLNSKSIEKLIRKAYKSLNPGGIYVIMDQIKDARGKSKLSKLIASTMGVMLFNQSGGRTYTFEEVEGLMINGGFSKLKLKLLHDPGSALIIGSK